MEDIQTLEYLVGVSQTESASLNRSDEDVGTVDPMPRTNAPFQESPRVQVFNRDEPAAGKRHGDAFGLSWIDDFGPLRE